MKKYLGFILLLLAVSSAAKEPLADIDNYFSSPRSVALGMAGAADNSAEDIFINQFGLAGLKQYGLYASSYKFFGDTHFTNGQMYFPLGPLGVGLGYRLKTIDDVQITPPDIIGVDGRPELGRVDYLKYQQGALYVAAGYSGLFGWQALDLGLAYKSYSVNNSLAEMDEISAQGNNLDIGLLARLGKGWSVSVIGRNVLNGADGSLVWRNGTAEQMLRSVVLGNKFSFNEGRLVYFLDANYYAQDYYPLLFNMGMESRILNDIVIFRGGIRQYALLTGETEQRVFNAVSAGLGLVPWRGVHLDYAYYPGDDLALEAVHYAGVGLNIYEIFTSSAPKKIKKETVITESLQVVAPPDFWVADNAELLCDLRIQGYASVNINDAEYALDPRQRRFAVSLNLEPGVNQLQVAAQSRLLKRNILRLKTAAELQAEGLSKDMVQNVFSPEQRREFSDQKIQLPEFAAYIVQSLDLRLPKDFDGIFTDMDILYFNGFLGKTSEGLLRAEDGYFSFGRLAEILARIDGYGDVLDASDAVQLQAVKILISTGYYSAADFAPLETEVTLAKAQSLFMRTAAANQRLVENFNGYPLVWLDRAGLDNGRLVLHVYNADRFRGYDWSGGGMSATGSIDAENYVSINIAPFRRKEATAITINVYDKPGKVWQFTAALPPLEPLEPLFLVRTEPRGLEAGARLKINFGVPAELAANSVQVNSSLLPRPLALQKANDSLWQADLPVPETASSGEYVLVFKVSAASGSYEKKFPVQVRGFESARPIAPVNAKIGARIITKTSAPVYEPCEPVLVYIGVVGDPAAVSAAHVVFPDESYIAAVKYGEHVWRAELANAAPGKNEYRAVVYFKDGGVSERFGSFRNGKETELSVKPKIPSASPAVKPVVSAASSAAVKTTVSSSAATKPRLNKVYYPVEIMLSPARPSPGAKISIRAKYDSAAVLTVYARIKGQKIPLQKNGAIWQAQYTLPAQKQDVYIQIYAQDKQGNLSMMEKLLAL